MYLLPACTQFETSGSVTASNRSLQWREKVIEPLFESQPDHTIMYQFAKKFGFDKELGKNYEIGSTTARPSSTSRLRNRSCKEINRGYLDDRLHRPVARSGSSCT